jgi:hypothetical protein
MDITKTIKGEKVKFLIDFTPSSVREKIVFVRKSRADDWTMCNFSDDFNYIIVPKGKFLVEGIDVLKLKVNKTIFRDVIEMCQNPKTQ